MKRFVCFVLCTCFLCGLIPSSYALATKEQILSDIDPMLDEQDYQGIINYFTLVKNESQTIAGATKPFVRDNTLILPANLTEISDLAFADDMQIEAVVIPESVISISDSAFSGIDNLTIIAKEGSYAYIWATNKGYAVSPLPGYPDEFTITLTADNFNDYFEFVVLPQYNAFGEVQDSQYRIGLKSKMYDLGYIIKGEIDQNIFLEYEIIGKSLTQTSQGSLFSAVYFTGGWFENINDIVLKRLIPGEITYINNNMVDSITIDKWPGNRSPDAYWAKITLKSNPDAVPIGRGFIDGYMY